MSDDQNPRAPNIPSRKKSDLAQQPDSNQHASICSALLQSYLDDQRLSFSTPVKTAALGGQSK